MRASRRLPRLLFQPGNAAMYACTGASPSAFAICGLPPARSFTGLAFAPALDGPLPLGAGTRPPLPAGALDLAAGFPLAAREGRLAVLGLALPGMSRQPAGAS